MERSKHRKTPFGGTDEDQAYILGFTHGDLTAWQVSGTSVMVTSTTTHPAFATLFRQLFDRYGHIYQYPMYETGKGYKWKVAVRLDNSFQFLLASPEHALKPMLNAKLRFLSWLAGLVDSDGTINIINSNRYARVMVVVHNTDVLMLESIMKNLVSMSYAPVGPYRTMEKGSTTPRGIKYANDMWNIALERTQEAQRLLLELPVRHTEKVRRKELALSLRKAEKWKDVDSKARLLSETIRDEVEGFIREAEQQYLMRRAKNQTEARRSTGH